nr:diguanylate cyclase [Halomonas sp.]
MLKTLWARLVVATLIPIILVTATLYPIFSAQLETRMERARVAADALLEAKYATLLHEMNESFNQVLATAEFPLLRRILANRQNVALSSQSNVVQRDAEQLDELFNTLLVHFGRYTRLALIDTDGNQQLSVAAVPILPSAPVVAYSATDAFQEAMVLQQRDLYVSPPYLGANANNGANANDNVVITPVIDIATPVFGASGDRLGVLLFTLDWTLVAANIPQALLVDAQGTSLLPDANEGLISFNHSLAEQWPDVWQRMALRNRGEIVINNQLLWFLTHDIRTHHYRSQAGMITSHPDSQPWRLGIIMAKPSLKNLVMESRVQLLAITLVYLLAIAFSLFWVLSTHRLRQLRQQARHYANDVQDLYENAPCGYHSLDCRGCIVNINRTELRWLGYRADEIIGTRFYRDFITPETRPAFDAAFQKMLNMKQEASAECELIRRDGSTLPVAILTSAQVTQDGFQYTRTTVFDLSERKQLEARLEQQAMTDSLTGLGNRRFLEDQAAMEIARTKRSGAPLSLIAIDLDHFKRVNDTHGHDVGDKVLQAFAITARTQLRDGDVLCRMGGEEFAVLLPDTTCEQAMQVAERLRYSVESTPVDIDSEDMNVGTLSYTASLGVTRVYPNETSLKPAIKRADQGLYIAKEAGRNQTHWREL